MDTSPLNYNGISIYWEDGLIGRRLNEIQIGNEHQSGRTPINEGVATQTQRFIGPIPIGRPQVAIQSQPTGAVLDAVKGVEMAMQDLRKFQTDPPSDTTRKWEISLFSGTDDKGQSDVFTWSGSMREDIPTSVQQVLFYAKEVMEALPPQKSNPGGRS